MQGETSKLRAARCRGGQVLLYSTRRLRLAIRNTHPPRRTLPASGQPTNGVGGSEPITAGHRALMTHSLVTRPPPVTPLAAGDQHAGIELWQRARAAIAKGSVAYSPIKRLPTTDAISSIDPGMGVALNRARACCGASTHGPMGSPPCAGALTFLPVRHQCRKGCTVRLHRPNGRHAEGRQHDAAAIAGHEP